MDKKQMRINLTHEEKDLIVSMLKRELKELAIEEHVEYFKLFESILNKLGADK